MDQPLEYLKRELQRRDGGEPPAEVQTHISLLLLGQARAWKVKKAVKLPYLDFSTPEQRLAMCRRELLLNRRTAPAIYRKVMQLVRTHAGEWQLDGEGDLVEAVLEMERFDEQGLLDRMAADGKLTPALVDRLAQVVAEFHAGAQPALQLERSGSQRIGDVLRINEQALEAARSIHDAAAIDGLVAATNDAWRRHARLLDARQHDGRVRLCHGDLHLRNIVVIDGTPTLFDCLEFDEGMATIDVLYDLAFVLMDLWHLGADALSNRLLNRYLDVAPQVDGLPLLGLFMSVRATVRGHVAATRAQAMPRDHAARAAAIGESRSYLGLAMRMLRPSPPRLLALGGLSGSGKSTAAAAVASVVGSAPGARVLSSDRIRKAIHGVRPETRLGSEAYRPEVSARVYAILRERAAAVLASGHSVVVDAVFDREDERESIAAVAHGLGVAFQGVWLEAPERLLLERVAARRGDPSDADSSVVRRQLERDVGHIAWNRLPADGDDRDWRRLLTLVADEGALGRR